MVLPYVPNHDMYTNIYAIFCLILIATMCYVMSFIEPSKEENIKMHNTD